jgi:hypothetical protein
MDSSLVSCVYINSTRTDNSTNQAAATIFMLLKARSFPRQLLGLGLKARNLMEFFFTGKNDGVGCTGSRNS